MQKGVGRGLDWVGLGIAHRFVLHDRDKLLAWDFDPVLAAAEAKIVKTPFRAPDANTHAERWVRSVTGECLDRLILFGMSSLQRAASLLRLLQPTSSPSGDPESDSGAPTDRGDVAGWCRRDDGWGSCGGVRAVPFDFAQGRPGRSSQLILPQGRVVSTGCHPQA